MVNLLTEIRMIQGSRELEKAEDIKSSVEDTINIRFQLDIQVDMSVWQWSYLSLDFWEEVSSGIMNFRITHIEYF